MPKKVEQYINERKEVFDRLLVILGINEENTFYLHDIDNNINKQKEIMNLVPDVKKYFICSTWTCFAKNDVKRFYLSLIKYLMKDMNYNMISSRASLKDNNTGKFLNATLYHVIKK